MDTQKLPFEITPQIKRYLEDVLYLVEEGMAMDPHTLFEAVFCIVQAHIPGEIQSPKQNNNRYGFWNYLEEQKCIKRFGFNKVTIIKGETVEPYDKIAKYLSSKKFPVERIYIIGIKRETSRNSIPVFQTSLNQIKNSLDEVQEVIGYSPGDIFFKLNDIKLIEELLEKIGGSDLKEIMGTKKNFDGVEVTFNDNKAIIQVGNNVCQLPPYKNEHFFCRAMFEYQANEPVDWQDCYEKMTGYHETYFGKPKESKENWHKVYDAMQALNERIKEVAKINEDLFIWNEKTIKRVK